MQVREQVKKSWFTVFFPMICGCGGSKSRLAKAASSEQSGQMRDEKLHAVVARSTFASKKAKNTSRSEHAWKLRCRSSARNCGAKHISKSKCTEHFSVGAFVEFEMSKKWTPLWREARFQVKMLKAPHVRTTFGHWDVVSHGRRKGLCTLSKISKRWRFCSSFKSVDKRGAYEEDRICEDAFSVAGAVQETCSSEMLIGPGAHFLRQVPFWSMRSSVCAALNTEGVEKSQNALIRGRQLCTQLSIIEGSLAELLCFLMLSTWKIADVFVTFKNWGHLKELLHFWCCQVQKLTKSRRIASFSNLSFSNDNYNYNYNCDHATLHTLRYTNYTTLQLQLEIQQQLLLH